MKLTQYLDRKGFNIECGGIAYLLSDLAKEETDYIRGYTHGKLMGYLRVNYIYHNPNKATVKAIEHLAEKKMYGKVYR